MVNNEVKNLIERLRDWYNTSYERNRKDMIQAADLLERIYSQPVELPEQVAFFDENAAIIDDAFRWRELDSHRTKVYTADQLTKAIQESTARALEAAAKECEARYMGDNNREDLEAKRCASAIRNLIGRVK